MKAIFLALSLALSLTCTWATAAETDEISKYAQAVLTALNTGEKAKASPSPSALRAAPLSGNVKLTVKPAERRVVTVEVAQPTPDGMWHMGINEIAWGTVLPQAPESLVRRFHSIQFSVVVTLSDSHKYSFASIKPLNGLVFVPLE